MQFLVVLNPLPLKVFKLISSFLSLIGISSFIKFSFSKALSIFKFISFFFVSFSSFSSFIEEFSSKLKSSLFIIFKLCVNFSSISLLLLLFLFVISINSFILIISMASSYNILLL